MPAGSENAASPLLAAVRFAELPVTRFAKYCPRTLRPAVSDQGGTAEGLGQRAASRFAQRVT